MFEQTSSEAPPDVRDARRRSTAVRFHTTLRARVHLSYYSLSLKLYMDSRMGALQWSARA